MVRCGQEGSQSMVTLYMKSMASVKDKDLFDKLQSNMESHQLAVLPALKLSAMPTDVLKVFKNKTIPLCQ